MLFAPCLVLATVGAAPVELHPDNPRIFLFRGKPTVLIGSTEHYGAVLNLDFDYHPYLETLAADGLNLTRTFSGGYREVPSSFGIKHNTLAPQPDRFCCPWPRTGQAGAHDGLGKFDLSRYDDAYFARLKDFLTEAGRRGIVVEYTFFCPLYDESLWQVSPMQAGNNVQGIGSFASTELYTLRHPELTAVQEAFVRKVVAELAGFDNLYYEICNEPYFGGITLEWQAHIAQVIADAEAGLPARHLIAQNIANGSAKVGQPIPEVSIFNYHYASPPVAVAQNWALNRPIGFDETGFRGSEDRTYRAEGWEFLLAGGSVFDHLDYSFTPEQEDGTAKAEAPGGGSPALRKQLALLKRCLEGLDLVRARPLPGWVVGPLDAGLHVRAFGVAGEAYLAYLRAEHGLPAPVTLSVELPQGTWQAEWLDPRTGAEAGRAEVVSTGGPAVIQAPAFGEDLALRLARQG
ncbi:MAG: hypothetical protein HYU66_24150 [Armatimonadetes bacterium]|nr:hypothetical protein [Armatimonadota bacterium]